MLLTALLTPSRYWDWTLDWENITIAPVWDTDTGFGGNGDSSSGESAFKGYCVTDGPFARLEVPYFEHIYRPHCLLRGFDVHLSEYRSELKPEALERLLRSPDYDTLNLGLENGPHIAIPKSINGDFSLHTAPSGRTSINPTTATVFADFDRKTLCFFSIIPS